MSKHFIFFLLLFQSVCFADEIGKNDQKIYVTLNNLFINDKSIYVYLENRWTEVDSLYSDNKGIYIKCTWMFSPFFCQNCHVWNESWRIHCWNCGLRRPD